MSWALRVSFWPEWVEGTESERIVRNSEPQMCEGEFKIQNNLDST